MDDFGEREHQSGRRTGGQFDDDFEELSLEAGRRGTSVNSDAFGREPLKELSLIMDSESTKHSQNSFPDDDFNEEFGTTADLDQLLFSGGDLDLGGNALAPGATPAYGLSGGDGMDVDPPIPTDCTFFSNQFFQCFQF